jgi:hypothetical protein
MYHNYVKKKSKKKKTEFTQVKKKDSTKLGKKTLMVKLLEFQDKRLF